MGGRELFVWYRVRRERADAARSAVAELHRSVRATWPELDARLLVRDEGATATWMETYSRSPLGAAGGRGVDAEIEAAIRMAARPLEALIEGPRHTEAFDVVA
jgi:uncharacterized protein DUF4936